MAFISNPYLVEPDLGPYLTHSLVGNGVNKHARSPASGSVNNRLPIATAFTLGTWFKTANGIPAGNQCFMSKWNPANPNGPEFMIRARPTTGYVQIYLHQNYFTQYKLYETQVNLCDNAWHHFMGVFNAGVWTPYFDNVAVTMTKTVDNAMTQIKQGTARYSMLSRATATGGSQGEFFDGSTTGQFACDGVAFDSSERDEMFGSGVGQRLRPSRHSRKANMVYSYDCMPPDDGTSTTGSISNKSDGLGDDLVPTNTVPGDIVADAP